MKKDEVKVGSVYAAKVSGRIVPVQIMNVSRFGGWYGTNLATRKEIRIRGAAKLRVELEKGTDGQWHPKKPDPIAEAIASFPETFGLSAYPGDRFKISRTASYISDSLGLQLYVQVERDGQWVDFSKGTPVELRAQVVKL